MKVLNFDYDTSHGFAWIEIQGEADSDVLSVQCCLVQDSGGDHIEKIERSDCGHNWGLCGDANNAAFDYYGENRCMKELFKYAKESGIELI